jgi:hypothetical protein
MQQEEFLEIRFSHLRVAECICSAWYLDSLVDFFIFFYFSQIYNLLYNGAISKYVGRKHLCGAIIQ